MTEYTLRGDPKNTINGHRVQCKIVTAQGREHAFQTFDNIFPGCRPIHCIEEVEVAA